MSADPTAQASVIRRPVLRYHGGKFRIAPWIISLFPAHHTYVEAYGGAGSVLLRKPRAPFEVYNDLDGELVTFFEVLRDPLARDRLLEQLALTPFSREEFDRAFEPTAAGPVERSRRLAIRSWQGYGSAGASKTTTGLRMSAKDVHLWSQLPDAIAAVGTRLEGVLIENRPALEVMLQHDTPATLHYVDPPYVFETRDRASEHVHRYYRHEMSDWDHVQLCACLRNLKGLVVLSGYDSDLYRDQLQGWETRTYQTVGSGNRGSVARTEWVWLNPRVSSAL